MTDKLSVFNGALQVLGERPLASLTENTPALVNLNSVWDRGFVDDILEQGLWNFALRTAKVDYTGDFSPQFGYSYAFEKPEDWIRTAAFASDEYFLNPMSRYADEQGYWFAEIQEIYVAFVSNLSTYGNDLSIWPQSFARFAECYLAYMVANSLAPKMLDVAFNRFKKARTEARSRDAMNQPTAIPAEGDWTRSRRGRFDYDRGSRSTLIG